MDNFFRCGKATGLIPVALSAFIAGANSSWGGDYLPYTDGHMDIGVRLIEGEPAGYWKNDSATVNGQISADDYPAAGLRALGVFDANTPPDMRPAGEQWDFFGVEANEPIYRLPSSGFPDTLPYLGFSAEHPSVSDFDEFRITLIDMVGPTNAVFSLYAFSANNPVIRMNTLDGYPAGSAIMEIDDHLHFNWAFSHTGVYDLTFLLELLDDGGNVALSGEDVFRFHITDGSGYANYGAWRRAMFSLADIEDEEVSGMNVVAPNGITNAQRYGMGPAPTVEFVWIPHNEQFYPGMRFRGRASAEDIDVIAESAASLMGELWTDESFIMTDSESVFHDPGLAIQTYRYEGDSALRMFRVRIQPDP